MSCDCVLCCHAAEVDRFREALLPLGMYAVMVTPESAISDFSLDAMAIATLSRTLGVEVNAHDLVVDVIQRMVGG